MTVSTGSNSNLIIGALVVAVIAIGGYAYYQNTHHSVSIELPGATAKIKTQ